MHIFAHAVGPRAPPHELLGMLAQRCEYAAGPFARRGPNKVAPAPPAPGQTYSRGRYSGFRCPSHTGFACRDATLSNRGARWQQRFNEFGFYDLHYHKLQEDRIETTENQGERGTFCSRTSQRVCIRVHGYRYGTCTGYSFF